MKNMTSNRPYLVRGVYDWILDNECTPYLVVDAFVPGVEVPLDYVTDGQIVLNLAPRAITHFHMDNHEITFTTRFAGIPTHIAIPMNAVLGIYARENGQGMVFQPEGQPPPDGSGSKKPTVVKNGGAKSDSRGGGEAQRPNLKIIK